MNRRWLFAWCIALFVPCALLTFVPAHGKDKPLREPDILYVPTPVEVVEKMFELADIRPGEVVYDLGCGDGRIPVMASKKFGVRSWGFDIDPRRVKESLENVAKNKVENLVTVKLQDIYELDLSKADVITLYLLPRLNVKLMPQLDKLKPGCRIVTHDFPFKDEQGKEHVRPKREVSVRISDGRDHQVYLYVTPLERLP